MAGNYHTAEKPAIGVVGLGLLGTALAERLLAGGLPVVVYNRTREKAAPLEALGARWSDNPLAECDRVVISLFTTDVVEQVLADLDAGLHAGLTLLDTTTGDPVQTPALGERLAHRGVRYLEVPISGSSEQTRRGQATVLVAGPAEAHASVRDVLDALVAACWPNRSRPTVAGILGAGINVGIFGLSQVAQYRAITPDDWRWIFAVAAIPAALGVIVLVALPESPKWLASRRGLSPFVESAEQKGTVPGARGTVPLPVPASKPVAPPLRSLFQGDLLRPTLVGILLAAIPLIGAWAGSKWMIPWADKVASSTDSGYKAATQERWALGAILGGLLGAPLAAAIGRRLSYTLISIGATTLTWAMFRWTAPLEDSFLPIVFAQGLVATLFFGWLPLYLPELFPVHVRATGAGVSMNIGRFATAGGVLAAVWLFDHFGGDYSAIGAACSLIYALGVLAILWAPNTRDLK